MGKGEKLSLAGETTLSTWYVEVKPAAQPTTGDGVEEIMIATLEVGRR